jgi:hypothetical protein
MSVSSSLDASVQSPASGRPKPQLNRLSRCGAAKAGWTPERRARQSAAIRRWQPWRHTAGPKTAAGKARVAMNALRHGHRSRAWTLRAKRIRNAIRLCAQTLLLVRVMRAQERRTRDESLQRLEALPRISAARLRSARAATEPAARDAPRATPPT